MTNTIQLTEEKVDMEHWLAVAEKIGQSCGSRSTWKRIKMVIFHQRLQKRLLKAELIN